MAVIPFSESEAAKKIANFKLPRYCELTNFPIVMRQLVAILDEYMSVFPVPGEEKLITQTMINSYVRNRMIKAPVNKEYNREHIMYLIAIGILKQVLSISDVMKILEMQNEQYPYEVAYEFFCIEVEDALKVTFDTRSFANFNHQPTVITPLTEVVRSAVLAFANRIYVKQSIWYLENQKKSKKKN